MIDLDGLFPRMQGKPVTVRSAWGGLPIKEDAPKFSPLYVKYWHRAKQGQSVGKLQSVKKLKLHGLAPTLTKSEGYGGLYHPTECRPIHTVERMRIGSYPDNFRFIGWGSAVECIGNSVPPMLMKAIATQIRYKLFNDSKLEPYPTTITVWR